MMFERDENEQLTKISDSLTSFFTEYGAAAKHADDNPAYADHCERLKEVIVQKTLEGAQLAAEDPINPTFLYCRNGWALNFN